MKSTLQFNLVLFWLCLLCSLLVKGDPCSPNPCENEGACNALTSTDFECICPSLFTGDNCSTITEDCRQGLGMENGNIPDNQIIASSSENNGRTGPDRGRLNMQAGNAKSGGWVAGSFDNQQWFTVQFHGLYTIIVSGLATQGRQDGAQWVTKYTLQYKVHSDTNTYISYTEPGQSTPKIFVGNTDQDSIVYQELKSPIISPYSVIFHVLEWHNGIALRVELYGCQDPCMSNPCANSGTCISNYTTGTYTCTCPPGYSGVTCATGPPPDPCLSNPCENGGACTSDSGDVTCFCPAPYTGDDCGIKACQDPLGFESRAIEDWQLTASSQKNKISGPENARLHILWKKKVCAGGWMAKEDDYNAWLQVDLNHPYTLITGISTQGKDAHSLNKWVTKYKVQYWGPEEDVKFYKEQGQTGAFKVFDGNTDMSSVVYHELNPPIGAQFFKFIPVEFIGVKAVRMELFGCQDACLSNPCLNGGTCISDYTAGTFTCVCPKDGIFNATCFNEDPCSSNPCQNGGNCSMASNQQGFTCNCSTGYIGDSCENKIEHGNWSNWFPWPSCNRPCNGGNRTRKRVCDNPEPAFGGDNCTGPANETETCNEHECQPEEINYLVKLIETDWDNNLANPASQLYLELESKIRKDVIDFYMNRGDDVLEVKVLEFSQGSVITSFNVSYPSVDSLQIVAMQEELAGGSLVGTPATLLSITTANVPDQPPVVVKAESNTSTSIDLEWTEVLDQETVLGYVIVYKEINEKFHVEALKSVAPTPREAVLEDLKKFTNYTIRIYAFTANGNGESSDAVSLRTQEDVPSKPPPKSVIQSTSSSTIAVTWEAIQQPYIHGILLGYEVRYAIDDGSSPLTWKNVTLDADTHEVVLEDLEYFTRYKVVICAKTSKGCGVEYSDIAYTFGDVPSKPPQSVTAHNLTSALAINVTWTPVPIGHVNGLLMGYSIKYRRIRTSKRDVFDTEEHTVTVGPNDLLVEFPADTYSIYEIRVAAFTQKGLGPYSEFVYGETCRCPKILYTNYWTHYPYLRVNEEDNSLGGVLGGIVVDMVHWACGICPAHGDTFIETTTNGKEEPSAKKSVIEVLDDMGDIPQISFPIYGNRYIEKYMGEYAYINLLESPGVAFIAAKRSPGAAANNMINALVDCIPLIVLSACMAFISGFIIWILDSRSNPDEFPASFCKGVGEGFWWSFVSMTTVGYGDRSPRSIPARIFAIAWTLTGLVIIGILVGAIASSLTSVTVDHSIMLYGTKIGAIHNSTEHQIAILKNARVNEERKYKNFEELRTALEDEEIDGVLVDTYVAAENKENIFNDKIYVKELMDRPFGYGVVLSGVARNVEQRCRDYIDMQIRRIYDIIQNTTKTLDPVTPEENVEESTGLFDSSSEMFFMSMLCLLGTLGVFTLAGLAFHCLVFVPGRKKVQRLEASTPQFDYRQALITEMRELVDSFHSEMSIKFAAIIKKYKRATKDIIKRQKRSKQGKEFTNISKRSSATTFINPAYSPGDLDMGRKLLQNGASPVSGSRFDMRERTETNLHKSKVKRS